MLANQCGCVCHVSYYKNQFCCEKCMCYINASKAAINTTNEIFKTPQKEQASDINKQLFAENIKGSIASIDRIINVYDNQFMQEAKTFLKHAEQMILQGLAANE